MIGLVPTHETSDGQADLKPGISGNRGHVDRPVVFPYDSHRCIQTQTSSLSHSLGGEEGFEDARLDLRRNARSGIADLDHGAIAFQEGLDAKLALAVHGIDSVVDN